MVDERIGESDLRRLGNIERMGNDRIAKRVFFKGVLVAAQWVGRGRGG